ncbi:hypothetical protein KY290_033263 [Solanum tuberosum]|uniref:Uncharacterized protein n=1 Tax=Solanum tuberosum TaxID=4113 RepID=A0ABQ7U0D3_SOLTU|nr:hypothetical protein KY289_032633 [Solanum tuberosum]KAH0647273.1 hypothetical protein KY285_032521 [Solanum tuberosum]KAH0740220.1 hypothetical protein KY290_033263 [Solanum tuberosum]
MTRPNPFTNKRNPTRFLSIQRYTASRRKVAASPRRQIDGTVRPTRTGGTQLYSRRLLPFPRQTVRLVLFQPYPVKNFQITHSPTSILGDIFPDFSTPINSLLLTVQRDVFET